ncbi:MAG: transketolase N-terminal domain protein [Parcubacteria group bacterium Gr01-1014_18]|nr:MAG: transketolase N-terminal domain protein [Parcubacteria group bacterium Greene0416_36]TSC81442.1 MAG: transketolase N-terminal domain protein [Parcubacteria group bacterium Gr01-1014_18]TSC99040.1 MAG: transketolase N-terminal domain protein [Parcubacteria group bacterium Greene1014_20]TSD07279.1 MAG: transketolase N-terminal domain protein [Parcubacteria group bacterium Greene0714_2]
MYTIAQLQQKSNRLREDVIDMLVHAGSGHSAGPLDLAEIFTALYFRIMDHDPKNPSWEDRDRLYLSCGHNAPIRYAAMIEAGYLPKSYLKTLRKLGSPLQGHPSRHDWKAVESSSGPLGQGSSVAVGAALSARMDKKRHWVYCVVSDGEQNEGQTWEAAMLAGKMKLHNLIFLMDRNNIQIDGYTENIMPLEPIADKYRAFNWHVIEVDGHNIEAIIDAVNEAKAVYEKPTMIICHTIPGKGVSFMERDYLWHGKPPTKDEAKIALRELRSMRGKIMTEYD